MVYNYEILINVYDIIIPVADKERQTRINKRQLI